MNRINEQYIYFLNNKDSLVKEYPGTLSSDASSLTKSAETAVTEITKVKSNAEAACNMCTRAALLHATVITIMYLAY